MLYYIHGCIIKIFSPYLNLLQQSALISIMKKKSFFSSKIIHCHSAQDLLAVLHWQDLAKHSAGSRQCFCSTCSSLLRASNKSTFFQEVYLEAIHYLRKNLLMTLNLKRPLKVKSRNYRGNRCTIFGIPSLRLVRNNAHQFEKR